MASVGAASIGLWTQLATWRQDNYERAWTNLETEEPFLWLSWEETYRKKNDQNLQYQRQARILCGGRSGSGGGWTGIFPSQLKHRVQTALRR